MTPLHNAAWNGDVAVVHALSLGEGAADNAKTKRGSTALHFAENYRHLHAVVAALRVGFPTKVPKFPRKCPKFPEYSRNLELPKMPEGNSGIFGEALEGGAVGGGF